MLRLRVGWVLLWEHCRRCQGDLLVESPSLAVAAASGAAH